MNKVEVKLTYSALNIYINGLIHLILDRTKLLSIQSWRNGERNLCIIEYQNTGGLITCEYTDQLLWQTILQEIDKVNVF